MHIIGSPKSSKVQCNPQYFWLFSSVCQPFFQQLQHFLLSPLCPSVSLSFPHLPLNECRRDSWRLKTVKMRQVPHPPFHLPEYPIYLSSTQTAQLSLIRRHHAPLSSSNYSIICWIFWKDNGKPGTRVRTFIYAVLKCKQTKRKYGRCMIYIHL